MWLCGFGWLDGLGRGAVVEVEGCGAGGMEVEAMVKHGGVVEMGAMELVVML